MSLTAGAMDRPLAVRPTSRAAAKRRVSSTVRRAAPARASSFDPLDVAASKSTSAARQVLFPEIVGSTPREWIASASRLGADVADVTEQDAGDILADRVISLMRQCDMPNGLMGVGYIEEDLPALVDKSFPQRRLMENGPKEFDRKGLENMFRDAMRYW